MTPMKRRRSFVSPGFTLVELMVALSGGLFLSVMVFALARDTSRFYQREGRLANATLAGMMGFERLKADIARAGYLSTPNIKKDPKVCLNPGSALPSMLQTLASIRINADQPNLTGNAAMAANSVPPDVIAPDEIVLAGSYLTTDEFPVRAASGNSIALQIDVGPMRRLAGNFGNVFRKGRVLRLTDNAGLQYFGVIDSSSASPDPVVTLAAAPALLYGGGPTSCGIQGNCTGCMVSVINFIRYQIRDLKADGYDRFKPLFDASAGAPGEASRTELVRQELNASGELIDTVGDLTTELVAEYAVDLGFTVTAELPLATNAVHLEASQWGQIFDGNAANVGNPQRVRAVRARLSVRSREADREAKIPGGGLYRFKLPDGNWARVRTFQADIALPNQEDVRW